MNPTRRPFLCDSSQVIHALNISSAMLFYEYFETCIYAREQFGIIALLTGLSFAFFQDRRNFKVFRNVLLF